MDKEVLIQYCEMKEEIKDIRRRKEKLEKRYSAWRSYRYQI